MINNKRTLLFTKEKINIRKQNSKMNIQSPLERIQHMNKQLRNQILIQIYKNKLIKKKVQEILVKSNKIKNNRMSL